VTAFLRALTSRVSTSFSFFLEDGLHTDPDTFPAFLAWDMFSKIVCCGYCLVSSPLPSLDHETVPSHFIPFGGRENCTRIVVTLLSCYEHIV